MKKAVLAVFVAAYAVCGLITYVEPCSPYLHVCDGAAVVAGNLTVDWLYALGSNLSGSAYDDSALWSNASNQDGRIIALEGVDYSPFFNNVTGNISELWANASNQDGRVIALEGVKSVYETPKNCPAGQFMNGTNTTDIDCGVVTIPEYYDDRWVIENNAIATNLTNNGGNIWINGNLTFDNSRREAVIDVNYSVTFAAKPPLGSVYFRILPEYNASLEGGFVIYRAGAAPGFLFYSPNDNQRQFNPITDNLYNLGSASRRWKNLYAVTHTIGDAFYDKDDKFLIREVERSDGIYHQFIPRSLLTYYPSVEYSENGIDSYGRDNWGTAEEWIKIGDANWNTTKKIRMSYDGDVVSSEGVSLNDLSVSVKAMDADAKSKADVVAALNAEIVSLKNRLDKLEGVKP